MKKILIITGIILITGLLLYAGWRYFIQSKVLPKSPVTKLGEELLIKKINPVTDASVFDYWITANKEIYYLNLNGSIYRISPGGAEEIILTQTIQSLSNINSSFDGSKAIISFGYPLKEVFAVFDTARKIWNPLPDGTVATDWDPKSSDRLIYLKNNGNKNSLNLLTLSNNQSSEIISFNQKDVLLEWVSPDEIYIMEKPSQEVDGSVWSFNIRNKTVKPIIKKELGLITKWFSNGSLGLKLSNKNRRPLLEFIDDKNRSLATLSFITVPDECVYDNMTNRIYCAVPANQNNLIRFPDDYLKKINYYADNIYLIPHSLGIDSTINNLIFTIFDAGIENKNIDMDRIKIQDNKLYFLNRIDNKLYSLGL